MVLNQIIISVAPCYQSMMDSPLLEVNVQFSLFCLWSPVMIESRLFNQCYFSAAPIGLNVVE